MGGKRGVVAGARCLQRGRRSLARSIADRVHSRTANDGLLVAGLYGNITRCEQFDVGQLEIGNRNRRACPVFPTTDVMNEQILTNRYKSIQNRPGSCQRADKQIDRSDVK